MNFMDALKNELNDGKNALQRTENGALGWKTTGKALLDMNFMVSSMRNWPDERIRAKFAEAYGENRLLAVLWLFFARDRVAGMGERRLFRVCLRFLSDNQPILAAKIIPLIPEYGRWDDIFTLLGSKNEKDVRDLLEKQLRSDIESLKTPNQPVSLLGKWLPSINSHSAATQEKAKAITALLKMSSYNYQRLCSRLRERIRIVERYMSANDWEKINYQAVPSRANLLYYRAFLRHDEQRFRAFLEEVSSGKKQIHSAMNFPHDIVHSYTMYPKEVDETLEQLWKALPDTVENGASTIVVADGSGSMYDTVGGTRVLAIEVADALAIYFAERLTGPYRDRYITFSNKPQLVDFSGCNTLCDKLTLARNHREVANTNIEAVFDLILDTAVKNKARQEDLPANVLILSDLEFDQCAMDNYTPNRYGYYSSGFRSTLFDTLKERFRSRGYQMPRLVFWNLNSRTGTIPVKENEHGVALVSGFSPNVARMVMSGILDPFAALVETLSGERYAPVIQALAKAE